MRFLARRRRDQPPIVVSCLHCGQPIGGAVYTIPSGYLWRPGFSFHDDRPACRLAARIPLLYPRHIRSYLEGTGWSWSGGVTCGYWWAPRIREKVSDASTTDLLVAVAYYESLGCKSSEVRSPEDVLYDMLAWQLLTDEQTTAGKDD